jgi:hypothetical protein
VSTPQFGLRGARTTEETFPDYSGYLASEVWPSIRDGRQDLEQVDVNEVPPQRAAAMLAKLVRWARLEPSGVIATLGDPDVREEAVRGSDLGLALSARALNLSTDMLHALFGEVGQGEPAQMKDVVAELAVAMGNDYPAWNLNERISLAIHLYQALDAQFLVKERSHP